MTPKEPSRPPPALNVVLFAVTIVTVTLSSLGFFKDLGASLTFAFMLLPILLCHEMGHYVLGRIHRMAISLPYFIPLPLGFGTLGAVILIRSPFPNRNALVDVGAAGPLAGAAVAIATHVYGVATAELVPVPATASDYGNSLIALVWRAIQMLQEIVRHGPEALAPERSALLIRDSFLTRWLTEAVRGPLPPGHDLALSPALLASSAILIITMLNLFPVGQLDGGHVAFAVFGRRHAAVGRIALLTMVALGVFFWTGWLAWALLGWFVVRVDHPPVVDDREPMSPARMLVAATCAALLMATFTPAPIEIVAVP